MEAKARKQPQPSRKQASVHSHHTADDYWPPIFLGITSGLSSKAIAAWGILKERIYPFGQGLWIPRRYMEAIDAILNEERQAANF